jgi:sec-independent protein translocase protein TatA
VPFGIGIWELVVVLGLLLLVFGPRRLPELGRQLGRGLRDFKDAVSSTGDERVLETAPAEQEPRS